MVQYVITGLSLPVRGANASTSFKIFFSITYGSSPTFVLNFNNLQINQSYNASAKTGVSSLLSPLAIGAYNVTIFAWNLVSNVTFTDTYQVGNPILNQNFSILTSGISPFVFVFGSAINFQVDMSNGSNVYIFI
jgi:hypothetical protein